MNAAQEWYVLLSGYGCVWTPVSIVLGRLEALSELTTGLPVTPDETRRLKLLHEAAEVKEGEFLWLVGHFDGKGRRVPDRKLVRVKAPRL